MTNNYKYFLSTVAFGTAEVFPFGEGSLVENYSPYGDYIADYKRTINGKMILKGADFNYINTVENSAYRCDPINLTIQKKCGGVFVDWYQGLVKLIECEFNPEFCEVTLKVVPNDSYTCYEKKKEVELDLFPLVPDRKVLKILYPTSTLEFVDYTTTTIEFPLEYWGGAGVPEDGGWKTWKTEYTFSGGIHTNTTYFVRETRLIGCDFTLNDPWILQSTTCPGSGRLYARNAVLYDYVNTREFDGSGILISQTQEFKVFGGATFGATEFDNGMRLADVLLAFANQCSLTIKSDFFQINPEEASSTNYVTAAISKVRDMLVFQKSDIKRPNSGNATKCIFKWEDFLNNLCILFNLKWKISAGVMIIEHVSFFTKNPGLNLVGNSFLRFKNSYTYDNNKIPEKEIFSTKEFQRGTDFEGLPILYDNSCTSPIKKDYVVESLTTDLLYCLNNPEASGGNVSDAGLFLAAAEIEDDQYILITEQSIIGSGMYPNNSLAWSQLLRDYHRYRRPFASGNMNGTDTLFFSVIPTKKGSKVSIPLCCGDTYNPLDLVETLIGSGEVEASSFSFKTGMLELELTYGAELLDVVIPVGVPDYATVYDGSFIDIDVVSNDFINGGLIELALIEITSAPTHGSASVLAGKIRYTPTPGYSGADLFQYRIQDSLGEYSTATPVYITVVDPMPTAVADNFIAPRNQESVFNVLSNDLPGAGTSISVIGSDALSAQGIPISVNSDGSFIYDAPDATVTDSFDYTIQNNLGHTDIGTVTIDVSLPPSSLAYDFAKSNANPAEACANYAIVGNRKTYYCVNPLAIGEVLYKDEMLTSVASYGFYSDGTDVYEIGPGGVVEGIITC